MRLFADFNAPAAPFTTVNLGLLIISLTNEPFTHNLCEHQEETANKGLIFVVIYITHT